MTYNEEDDCDYLLAFVIFAIIFTLTILSL